MRSGLQPAGPPRCTREEVVAGAGAHKVPEAQPAEPLNDPYDGAATPDLPHAQYRDRERGDCNAAELQVGSDSNSILGELHIYNTPEAWGCVRSSVNKHREDVQDNEVGDDPLLDELKLLRRKLFHFPGIFILHLEYAFCRYCSLVTGR